MDGMDPSGGLATYLEEKQMSKRQKKKLRPQMWFHFNSCANRALGFLTEPGTSERDGFFLFV